MGMDNAYAVNYVSMREQRQPADVPDEQQREKSIYYYVPQSLHSTNQGLPLPRGANLTICPELAEQCSQNSIQGMK